MDLISSAEWRHRDVELFVLEQKHVGADYVRWLNDTTINRFLESRFTTHTQASVSTFVQHCRDDADTLFMGIRSLSLNQRHIGNVKLASIDRRHGLGEVGILIGESDAWGRGLASSALTALAALSKKQLGLRKLTAGCYVSNVGSQKAFERAGFVVEGVRRDHFILNGKPEDLILMGLWLNQQGPE